MTDINDMRPSDIVKEDVGCIGNHYGGLCIAEYSNKYYWCIENVVGGHWEEIPESLYRELAALNRVESL